MSERICRATGGPVLRVERIAKAYGTMRAVQDVSFAVHAGQVVGLLGPNGAGKTTTLSIIAGLGKPDAGRVLVGGVDVKASPELARSKLGFAAQDIGIYPRLSVRQNLEYFAELEGLRHGEAVRRAAEVLALLGLEELADRRASHLSGGERRRVHVGTAIVHRPPLVLLDEPTAGMDVLGRSRFLELVRRLAGDGSGVCFSSHYIEEVERLCDRVIIVNEGVVAADGTVPALVGAFAESHLELSLAGGERRVVNLNGGREATECALRQIGESLSQLVTMNVVRPSLEAVFLSTVGRQPEEVHT